MEERGGQAPDNGGEGRAGSGYWRRAKGQALKGSVVSGVSRTCAGMQHRESQEHGHPPTQA